MDRWLQLIRDVPDFPKPGIVFKDITPMLADALAFECAIEALARPWHDVSLEAVVGIESRGFILGAALARRLGTGFVPVRKPGKLPAASLAQEYALEYGKDRLEMHVDALHPDARVMVIDDVLATGGTLQAALALVQRQGARVLGASVLVELGALHGRDRLDPALQLHAAAVL